MPQYARRSVTAAARRLAGCAWRSTRACEKIGYKIREAQLQKIPYMLVVGDREVAEGAVAVRSRSGGDLGSRPLDAFIASALEEVQTKGQTQDAT